jgi:hypothetical protein
MNVGLVLRVRAGKGRYAHDHAEQEKGLFHVAPFGHVVAR